MQQNLLFSFATAGRITKHPRPRRQDSQVPQAFGFFFLAQRSFQPQRIASYLAPRKDLPLPWEAVSVPYLLAGKPHQPAAYLESPRSFPLPAEYTRLPAEYCANGGSQCGWQGDPASTMCRTVQPRTSKASERRRRWHLQYWASAQSRQIRTEQARSSTSARASLNSLCSM
jgi:hypothetical protein